MRCLLIATRILFVSVAVLVVSNCGLPKNNESSAKRTDNSNNKANESSNEASLTGAPSVNGLSADPAGVPNVSSGSKSWSCSAFTLGNQLWMRSFFNGAAQFDYRIGPGGTIVDMRDALSNYGSLMVPAGGSLFDKVLQWTMYSALGAVSHTVTGVDSRWNMRQSGNSSNVGAIVTNVELDSANCAINVYTVSNGQWNSVQDNYLGGTVSSFVRYRLVGTTDLWVRRVTLIDGITNAGAAVSIPDFYMENLVPLSRNVFDSVGFAFNQTTGAPTSYEGPGQVQMYPFFDATKTRGYAAVFKYGASLTSGVTVGVVAGKQLPCVYTNGACAANYGQLVYNMGDWGPGNMLALMPTIKPQVISSGTVIDQQFYIVPAHGLANSIYRLEGRAAAVPPIHIVPPGTALSGDLVSIVPVLKAQESVAGSRVVDLAPLSSPIPAPTPAPAAGASSATHTPSGAITLTSNQTVTGLRISTTSGPCINGNGVSYVHITNNIIGPCGPGANGVGINLYGSSNVSVDYNSFDNVASGLFANAGAGVTTNNIVFVHNYATRIRGPFPRGQIAQLAGINGSGHIIECNVSDQTSPGYLAGPEDQINLFQSNGTAASPILVRYNKLRGGGPSTAGGGILAGDGGSSSYETVDSNIVVSPGQYGVAIAGGTNLQLLNNQVYSQKLPWTNVGTYIWNQYKTACSGHMVSGNKVNWTNKDGAANPTWNAGNCGPIAEYTAFANDPTITADIWNQNFTQCSTAYSP